MRIDPQLHRKLSSLFDRAYVPYSHRPAAAVALLRSGDVIPGVRVENASFPLTISAAQNLISTVVAFGCQSDVVMVAITGEPEPGSWFTSVLSPGRWSDLSESGQDDVALWTATDVTLPAARGWYPIRHGPSDLFDGAGGTEALSPEAYIALARNAARRAHTPASAFPVGTLIHTEDGFWVPGCNVEFDDWSRGLCAERNALSTLVSYGLGRSKTIAVSCPNDPSGTPCGACRQVLIECAPSTRLLLDRGEKSPTEVLTDSLLPMAFTGSILR